MKHRALILCLALSASLAAQQTGDANRDYAINGIGGGGTSFVTQQLLSPGPFDQAYTTQDAGAPVIWVSNTNGCIGQVVTPSNSVDICLDASLQVLGNGADPSSFLNQIFFTDPSGNFNLGLTTGPNLTGITRFFTMAHIAASSPDGFWVSQTHSSTWVSDGNLSPGSGAVCTSGGSPVSLGDDTSTNVALGFSFTFYGTTYTDCHIGSNGFLTFGSGDTNFTETVSAFLGNQPRIAIWWDDLNPSQGGSVSFFTDNSALAEVCFNQLPEYFNTGANDFLCQISSGGLILCEYGAMSAMDGIVGTSPGNNADPNGTAVNLSIANNPVTPGNAVYELFDTSNPNDVAGFQVQFIQDSNGDVIMQL